MELVEEAVGGDEDWVKVRKGDGGEGVVPQSYVEVCFLCFGLWALGFGLFCGGRVGGERGEEG